MQMDFFKISSKKSRNFIETSVIKHGTLSKCIVKTTGVLAKSWNTLEIYIKYT